MVGGKIAYRRNLAHRPTISRPADSAMRKGIYRNSTPLHSKGTDEKTKKKKYEKGLVAAKSTHAELQYCTLMQGSIVCALVRTGALDKIARVASERRC